MKPDQIRGHLDLLILSIVRAGPMHGYAIVGELLERSGGRFDVPEGTLYPALHRLERSGLLESSWADGTTRRRRIYQVTRLGVEALAAKRSEWRELSVGVQSILAVS